MTNRPVFLDELINKASKAAGNDSRLAEQIGVNRQKVSQWRHGHQPCPPADVALMAHIAGLDAEAWTARAVICQHEGTEKGKLLQQALKKALLATGGVIGLCGQTAAATVETAFDFIRCIFCLAKSYGNRSLIDRVY
jgi:transcriptional regulator with XRE-family HTH domain